MSYIAYMLIHTILQQRVDLVAGPTRHVTYF